DPNNALNHALNQNIFGSFPFEHGAGQATAAQSLGLPSDAPAPGQQNYFLQAIGDMQHGFASLNDALSVTNYMQTAHDLTADQSNSLNQRIQNDMFMSMLDFMHSQLNMAENYLNQQYRDSSLGQGGAGSQAGGDNIAAPAGTPAKDS